MGYSLEASSKLMYYPTSEFETHRLLGLLGEINIEHYIKEYIKNNIIGTDKYRELFCISADNYIDFNHILYDYFLQQKDYKSIKEFCTLRLGFNNNDSVVIADLFAGEAKWIDCFYDLMNKDHLSNDFISIANELDEDRYLQFEDNYNITDKYNKSFEELQLPQNSISLMLFNPPYGETNKVRNVRHYLQMILDRKILYNPNETNDYKTGYMVFVIRKDDFMDSLDLICQNFRVYENSIYKVHTEEYNKYKQYVFIAQIKRFSYNMENTQDVADFQNAYNRIKSIIDKEPEFNLNMYDTYKIMNYPYVDYKTAKENFKYSENKFKYISKNDSVWQWIKDITALKDLNTEKINMPKNPKIGELAMLISSGYINGEMELDNNRARHVVVGGTKTVKKEEIETHKDTDGKKVTTTKTIKLSKPYLNILCNQNGKITIKELGEADVE